MKQINHYITVAAESGGDFYKTFPYTVTNRNSNNNNSTGNIKEEHVVSRATSRRLVGVFLYTYIIIIPTKFKNFVLFLKIFDLFFM